MAFRQEQFDTGLAATALGALVLFALLVGGFLVLGRLSGTVLFGTNLDSGDPFATLPRVADANQEEAIPVDAPPPAELAPAPASPPPGPEAPAPTDPPAVAPADAPVEPPPAPTPAAPPAPVPSPVPEVPTLDETLDDPVGSVGRAGTATVEQTGSAVSNLLDTTRGVIFGDSP